jgi:RNA polymerase sigma-32 factor
MAVCHGTTTFTPMERPMLDFSSESGFQKYGSAIERYPVLDRERELALSTSYHGGDKAAGDLLVCCNLRYVVKIAVGYRGYGFRLSELVAEGNVGLLQAVRRFEPERGLRFMTYASYWVRAHVLSYILKHWSLVGVGTGPMQSKLFFRLHREKAKLLARTGYNENVTTRLAERFNCSEDRIRRMEQRIDGRDVSLDAKAYRDGNVTIMDTLSDASTNQEAAVSRDEVATLVRDRVTHALERLDERERVIVRQRLLGGQKETLSALGKQLGLSRERVRQLEQRVKTKLRRSLADLAPEETHLEAA